MTPIRCLDLRSQQAPAGPDPKCGKIVGGKLVLRDPKAIDAICLHQTACILSAGNRPDRHVRALGVHAHVTAFDDGVFAPAYPLRAYVYHGNGANSRSIGLEVEGLFNGFPLQGGKEPSELVVDCARAACSWIVAEAAKEGITIKHVVAHRQYSASRVNDPGWSIWRRVAIEHCIDALGLTSLPELTDRDGKPIPKEWY